MSAPSNHLDSWKVFAMAAAVAVAASVAFAIIVGVPLGSFQFVTAPDDIGEAAAALQSRTS